MLRRALSVCVLGIGVLLFTAVARDAPSDALWYLAHLLPAGAVIAFGQTAFGARVSHAALVAYVSLVPALAVLASLGTLGGWSSPARTQLFTTNPNLLGADIVAAAFAVIAVWPGAPLAFALPVLAIAVLSTGSRLALFAMAAATLAWLVLPSTRTWSKVGAIMGLAATVALVAVAHWQVEQERTRPNLLRESTTLDSETWLRPAHSQLSITRNASPGPFERTRADRLSVPAGDTEAHLTQWVERSHDLAPYTASVYLRAEAPQIVRLSTLSGYIDCDVTLEWGRCITPPGLGNGRSWVYLRIERAEPGPIDILVYGPQLERSSDASPYVAKGATLFSASLVSRFTVSAFARWVDEGRLEAAESAWRLVLEHPLFGVGRDTPFQTMRPEVDSDTTAPAAIAHSHNLLLEVLFRDGAVGLLAWLAMIVPALTITVRTLRGPALPWLFALAILNTFDMTLLHAGSYYSAAVVIGAALRSARAGGLGRAQIDPHKGDCR